MKKTFCIFLMLVLCVALSACGCDHQWQAANCEHPKTCTLCGKTEGEPLDHSWQEADCEHPRTCTLCGKTEGEALGHSGGEWEKTEINRVDARECYVKHCFRCEMILDRKEEPLTTLREKNTIAVSTDQFQKRLENMLKEAMEEYNISNVKVYLYQEEDGLALSIQKNGILYLTICFGIEPHKVSKTPLDHINMVYSYISMENYDAQITNIAVASVLMTIDPRLTCPDALRLWQKIVDNEGTPIPFDGIGYHLTGEYLMALVIQPGSKYYSEDWKNAEQ